MALKLRLKKAKPQNSPAPEEAENPKGLEILSEEKPKEKTNIIEPENKTEILDALKVSDQEAFDKLGAVLNEDFEEFMDSYILLERALAETVHKDMKQHMKQITAICKKFPSAAAVMSDDQLAVIYASAREIADGNKHAASNRTTKSLQSKRNSKTASTLSKKGALLDAMDEMGDALFDGKNSL